MSWMKRDDLIIHYQWIKSEDPFANETLILIHGIGLDMYSWDFVIPYFRKHYHILRYDLRGHGESDAGIEKRNIDVLTGDLLFLMKELSIETYHLIGQGLGGFVGVKIAGQQPGQLRTVILFSVPIHYPKQMGDKVVSQRKYMVDGQENMLAMGKEIVDKACYIPTEAKASTLLNAYKKVSPEVYFELFHTGFGPEGVESLRRIKVPILILSGSEDVIFPPELSSAILNFNPNARCYTVPEAAFMIQMDQPKLVADWIGGFIQKHRNSSSSISLLEHDYQKHLTSELYSEIRGLMEQDTKKPGQGNILLVNTIHGFSVYLNGNRLFEGWGKRKAKQLLIYLSIQQSATREELCDIFWPEADLGNARNRLRVALHHLKQLLERNGFAYDDPILITDREHVFLQAKLKSDLQSLLDSIRLANRLKGDDEKASRFKQLLSEQSENMMPGLYEDWFLEMRSWIEKQRAEMALFLADWFEDKRDYKSAAFYLELYCSYYGEDEELNGRILYLNEHRNAYKNNFK
ncbi:alpha/beta hydrolase [Sediminibacillus halophilus]|uniref:Pimeloyl-ACP methyl ester carboxylesterase n=1 Tax=Sediminibacillus halophilus TaxID=482461 RepID=A0A1G9TC92_9BACI|nr:alpha/beta hydrolase [Sediminibacillus halophilus]SDM45321.1 Pimeloyl-ACP methyl ester carboxylesterase [Sediminibacillus halophilus]